MDVKHTSGPEKEKVGVACDNIAQRFPPGGEGGEGGDKEGGNQWTRCESFEMGIPRNGDLSSPDRV